MYIRNKNSSNLVRSEDGEFTYELIGRVENATQQFSIAEIELEPGQESLRHSHPHIEEAFYVIAGQGIAHLSDNKKAIKEGDCIFVPAGCCHSLINSGEKKLIYLSVCSPAWLRHSGTKGC